MARYIMLICYNPTMESKLRLLRRAARGGDINAAQQYISALERLLEGTTSDVGSMDTLTSSFNRVEELLTRKQQEVEELLANYAEEINHLTSKDLEELLDMHMLLTSCIYDIEYTCNFARNFYRDLGGKDGEKYAKRWNRWRRRLLEITGWGQSGISLALINEIHNRIGVTLTIY